MQIIGNCVCVCVCVCAQLCLTLCDIDYSPPGSSVHEILQVRILKWVALPSFRGSSLIQGSNPGLLCPNPGLLCPNPGLPHCRRFLYHLSPQGSPQRSSEGLKITTCMCFSFASSAAQSCLTLCDARDGSPPGSSVHGLSQARMLEWVVLPFSRGSAQPRDRTCVSCIGRWILYHLSHQG